MISVLICILYLNTHRNKKHFSSAVTIWFDFTKHLTTKAQKTSGLFRRSRFLHSTSRWFHWITTPFQVISQPPQHLINRDYSSSDHPCQSSPSSNMWSQFCAGRRCDFCRKFTLIITVLIMIIALIGGSCVPEVLAFCKTQSKLWHLLSRALGFLLISPICFPLMCECLRFWGSRGVWWWHAQGAAKSTRGIRT